jgi:hypothetical protein
VSGECAVKINEIVQEGFLDNVKGIAGRAKNTFKKATNSQTAKNIGKNIASTFTPTKQLGLKGVGQAALDAGASAAPFLNLKNYGAPGRVANMLAKQLVGKDPKANWIDRGLPAGVNYYNYNTEMTPRHEGEVFQVKVNGKEYFKSYKQRWYERNSTNPRDYSATHPLDKYSDYEVLDRALAQGNYNVVSVKQDPYNKLMFTAVKSVPNSSIDNTTKQSNPGSKNKK